MTAPRPVFPGQFVFITRRCTQRQFLLRPDKATNEAYTYCLAEAAQRFEMEPVLSQMMSNHHHSMFWDPHGNHVEFRQHFHNMMAKSQNCLRGRWENMWTTSQPSVVEVVTAEDVLEKLVYIATNPVEDGLVEKVHNWPGPNFVAALLSGKRLRARRPKHFFREDGPMPKEVELVMKLPDHFEGKEAFLAELRRRIAEVEDKYARERTKKGWQVLGRRRIKRQSWRDSPKTKEPRRQLNPQVAARDKQVRIATLERNRVWRKQYRQARTAWLAGLPAEFPYGTYWLRKFAKVVVKPPPERT